MVTVAMPKVGLAKLCEAKGDKMACMSAAKLEFRQD